MPQKLEELKKPNFSKANLNLVKSFHQISSIKKVYTNIPENQKFKN